MHIKVKTFPAAASELVQKLADNHFEIYLREPPRRGMANNAVIRILKSYLKLTGNVRIIHGHHSRNKIVEIND
jgi:uncharacterized protein YggU (UPF0235/DUF167 family)